MIVKQSRIQKMLRWLINESKNSAHSAVSFDGDCRACSTHWFRPECAQPRPLQLLRRFQLPLRLRLPSGLLPKYRIIFEHIHNALRYLNLDKPPTYVMPTGDTPFLVGFCVERDLNISLDEQVKHLLNLYDSDFDATRLSHSSSRTCSATDEKCFANSLFKMDLGRYM
ncbi:BQ5605_C033g11173 [Microbotryum silenes-dioicae]|uniref:BQ5605_C033g11173 protein n=1 Tax=Microbotryum silenes-dioicae TaxID=796604 RepID=A0A2X0PH90_9BASI|nr:BQ5605_C033g11173 [Microbotryum silenes-dioicae]